MNPNPNAKRILCYGDSLTFGAVPGENRRFGPDERWTGILQSLLGDGFEVIEEGLGGRTTDLDDPDRPGKNGLDYFYSCVRSHLPLDLIVLFLGTNDLKQKFGRSPEALAKALRLYHASLRLACQDSGTKQPALLLLSPPLIHESHWKADTQFRGASEKSERLTVIYEAVAKEMKSEFLDASLFAKPSEKDGVHLEAEDNRALAQALAKKVKVLLA